VSGRRLLRGLALAIALVSLSGCGSSVTFKRGATPDTMADAEAACRAGAAAEGARYADCMRERGWFVATLADGAGTAAPDEPGAQADPGTAWFAARRAPTAAAASSASPASVAPPPAALRSDSVHAAAVSTPATAALPSAAASAAAVAAPAATTTASGPRPFDPLAPVGVSSWWKLGGTAAGLDGSVRACIAALGNAHRPEPGLDRVTAGMRACLRADGWYALGR
jgi:hypothetical protein